MITIAIIAITVITSITAFSNGTLFYRLSLNPYSISHRNEWWRIISHGFIHGDYTHLLINMLVFWSFGTNIERMFNSLAAQGVISNGNGWFLALYFGALAASSIKDVLNQKNNPMYNSIGASGAVSAVVFTSIFFSPWSKIYFMAVVPIPAILFGVFYLWYENYAAKRGGGRINHSAHIYGAIYGFLFPIAMDPTLIVHFFNQLMAFRF